MHLPQDHFDLVENHGVVLVDVGSCVSNAHSHHILRRAAAEAPLFEAVYHIVEAEEVHVAIEFAQPSTS